MEELNLSVNARALQIYLEKIVADEERFTWILTAQVVMHIKDYQTVLEKLATFLEQDGQFISADFDENPNFSLAWCSLVLTVIS